MIKKLFILSVLFILFSCEPAVDRHGQQLLGTKQDIATNSKLTYFSMGQTAILEGRVDGCQYLYMRKADAGYFSHKGNCDNPIHCHNK